MKPIPTDYRKNGWFYKLVERTEKGAIYSQSRHPDLPHNGKAAAYEVVRVRKCEGRTIAAEDGVVRTIEPYEKMPSSEEWGRHGWTFPDLGGARYRLAEISTIFATPTHKEGHA